MRFPFSLPWLRPADGKAVPERKMATGGFMAVAVQGGQAFWSGRSYAALAREGFMKNPVAHRAARMVAE
ncbi:phage portal protein, partial [Rhizobium sp. BR5]